MISQIAVLQALLVVLRLAFDILNFVPAGKCIYYSHTVEKCGTRNMSRNMLPQEWSNQLNTTGALVESVSSIILLLTIFKWRKFHTKNYFFAILRVGHFWVWFLLCITNILTQLIVDIVHGKNHEGNISISGIGIVLELILLTFLSCAINFISKETYDMWVEERYGGNLVKQRYFSHLYHAVLAAYFARNIGLLLYDTALVAMSISLIKGDGSQRKTKGWDSVILVLMCAFRGSFVKFYFAKLFQGQQLPTVSKLFITRPRMGPSLSFVTNVFFFSVDLCYILWSVLLHHWICIAPLLELIAPLDFYCASVSQYYLSFKLSGKVVFFHLFCHLSFYFFAHAAFILELHRCSKGRSISRIQTENCYYFRN